MDTDQKAKSSAMEFTPEDVEANRVGELSDRQRDAIEFKNMVSNPDNRRIFFGVILTFVLIVLIGLDRNRLPEFMGMTCFYLVLLVVVIVPLGYLIYPEGMRRQQRTEPAIRITKVLSIEGETVVRQKRASEWFRLRIKGYRQSFNVNTATAAFFRNPGKYRVYYLEGSEHFLSAEYLPDSLFK